MLVNWLAGKRKPNKKMNDLQKAIDEPNKAIESIAQNEKYFLDLAAEDFENASKYEDSKPMYLKRKEKCEEMAKEFTDMLQTLRKELDLSESLKNREIEALHNEAGTRPSSFFF